MKQSDVYGLYADSWNGEIDPAAFSHPAKFSRGLIRFIYQHAIEQGYIKRRDRIVDPFGGVALGGLEAMLNGMHWTGCELEEKFVQLGQANINLWQSRYGAWFQLGTARIIQGDSRQLAEIVGGAGAVISSPPYARTFHGQDDNRTREEREAIAGVKLGGGQINHARGYGHSPGQLGSMHEGSHADAIADAVISSPPFSGDKNLMPSNGQGVRSDMIANGRPPESPTQQSPGNLATLRADQDGFDAAVSSPPYADAISNQGEGPGARYDFVHHNGANARKQSNAAEYGRTEGNLGNMNGGGYHAAISSPPFESSSTRDGRGAADMKIARDLAEKYGRIYTDKSFRPETYGVTEGNIGNDTGETFWTAARQIVEQVYQVLKPEGVAIWVCGDFVRNRQRVHFGRQWLQLCEVCGFVGLEWIRAWKTEHNGTQLGLFGEDKELRTDRVSFFRRLANEKNPEAAILNEDVIIVRKPLLAYANGRAQEPL